MSLYIREDGETIHPVLNTTFCDCPERTEVTSLTDTWHDDSSTGRHKMETWALDELQKHAIYGMYGTGKLYLLHEKRSNVHN